MGTKNNPGAFDCYANAAPDEPMFVLLGRDKHAAALVNLWAAMRQIEREDQAKLDEAETCAADMIAWLAAVKPDVAPAGVKTLVAAVVLLARQCGAHVRVTPRPRPDSPAGQIEYDYDMAVWPAVQA